MSGGPDTKYIITIRVRNNYEKYCFCTSAAVLAVFASSAAVFVNDGNVHTGNLDNKTEATGGDFFTNNEGGLTKLLKISYQR